MALSACIYHSLLGHLPEYDRGIKRARFAVLRLTKVPAVLIEGGFLTEQGECKLIANKEWRGKLAQRSASGSTIIAPWESRNSRRCWSRIIGNKRNGAD